MKTMPETVNGIDVKDWPACLKVGTDPYNVYRDSELKAWCASEAHAWGWLHRQQSQSVDHACKYEGWELRPVFATDDALGRSFLLGHNRAVSEWINDGFAERNERKVLGALKNERAMLGFLTGLHALLSHESMISGDYYTRDVWNTLGSVFGNMLNLDLGRLDGSHLSSVFAALHFYATREHYNG